jgi:hypothetical protein
MNGWVDDWMNGGMRDKLLSLNISNHPLPPNHPPNFPYLYTMEMYKITGSDIFVVVLVAAIFILGIYTLIKFKNNRNF